MLSRNQVRSGAVFIAIFVTMMLVSCDKQQSERNSAGGATDFRAHSKLVRVLKDSDSLIIHEGLPHPSWERELYQSESQRPEAGDPGFYKREIHPTAADVESIVRLFTASDSLIEYQGPKGCGLFHGDWRFDFRAGEDTHRLKLCFNCQEVKAFGPSFELYCDINYEPAKSLKALLEKYRRDRPKSDSYDSLLAD